jgi:hypothetical protein
VANPKTATDVSPKSLDSGASDFQISRVRMFLRPSSDNASTALTSSRAHSWETLFSSCYQLYPVQINVPSTSAGGSVKEKGKLNFYSNPT